MWTFEACFLVVERSYLGTINHELNATVVKDHIFIGL